MVLRLMSIGFLVKPDQPLIWRGPMLHSAIRQFLSDVEWGELDYLIVDLPPGTGDAALSLTQSLPLSGGRHCNSSATSIAGGRTTWNGNVPPAKCSHSGRCGKYELFRITRWFSNGYLW